MKNSKSINKTRESQELARLIYEWHHSYLPTINSCSPHTVRSYKTALKSYTYFLEEVCKITPLSLSGDCFTLSMLESWRQWIRDKRGISNGTCNQRMAAIMNLLEYMGTHSVQYTHLYFNARAGIKPLRSIQKKVTGISRDAVKELLATPDPSTKKGLRDVTLMMFSYGVGARISEVLSLKIADLNFSAKSPCVTLHGKGEKMRTIYLHDELQIWLKRYIKVFHGDNPVSSDLVFYSVWRGVKGPLSTSAVDKRLKLISAKAHEKCKDVPINMHSHQWRHAAACHWREDGINIVEIKELLGHSSLQTTMVYQDVTDEQKLAAIKTLDLDDSGVLSKKWHSEMAQDLSSFLGF